ncbi:putative nucleic-acid-binding protein containing a Zn-ribbon [Variovorax sp. PBS-H4]|uniref:Zn-ribbon domain-containing OB-fold protein n=1 Tax=Variovorax sp. PBS-H4 TaxID=434008 RepID=UPI00131706AB|nr:OB-fold domain-containing protein [Variovorax sp. PBS-H4]VTU36530.1 putative nucleic-acid-binding protein containing a Zn-ribbon [Variovorax sp. PBS-H4]
MNTHLTDISAPFWNGLRERKLMLQFDNATGRAQFYPRPQSLFSESGVQWRPASGRGAIFALTHSRVAPPALEKLVPYALALVQLAEGPRVLARIDAPYGSLAIGQAVAIDWDSTGEGFPVFKPASAS